MANLSSDFLASLRQDAKPLQANADLDPVLDRIGDARLVLLGEASHGTSEYYRWRAQLSKRLVLEKKFSFHMIAMFSPTHGLHNLFHNRVRKRS